MEEALQLMFLDNPLRTWLIALGLTAAVFLTLRLLARLLGRRLHRAAKRTGSDGLDLAADLVEQTRGPFLLLLAAFAGSALLQLPESWGPWGRVLLLTATFVQTGVWANRLVEFLMTRALRRRLDSEAEARTVLRVLGGVARVVVWTLILLLVLDNLPGVEVSSLLASLGVAGIAIGLALQNVLGDLFASMSIALDRPFVIGDFIIVGDMMGTVEHIGMKSTRLRSLSGEQLVFSNADLLQSRVRNYKRMQERRVIVRLRVTYTTPRDRLELLPDLIRRAIQAEEQARFDRAHFAAYGDFALEFEYVYYVLSPDYNIYMDIQQRVNLRLHAALAEHGVEFAYPTQTIHLLGKAGA